MHTSFVRYSNSFREKAKNAGFSEENILKCLAYANPLIEKGFPVIYNTSHLSALVGYDKVYIKKAALFTNSFYRSFNVLKKNKKSVRVISEPLPSLKEIQQWLLTNVLYEEKSSRFAKAYIKKRNIKENAKFHVRKDKVLNMDFKDFFTSIKRDSVEKIFLSFGYSSNISNLLGKLCCLKDCLPQGAPTSPYLSNLYLKNFDDKIFHYCNDKNIRYSRYADDLTFSGNFEHQEIISYVSDLSKTFGLDIHDKKTSIMLTNTRQVVTGIVVNDIIQAPKPYRNKIRLEMYFISKYGLADHIMKLGIKKSNYAEHLLGKINYIVHLNPSDKEFLTYRELLKKYI